MNMKKLMKLAAQIIFYGAIWGLAEASLGYLLHFLPPLVAGIVMFPIAVFILMKAFRATGSRSALILVGTVAAGIKAVDFLLPGMSVFKTINPMISIMFESLVVAVAVPMLNSRKQLSKIAGSLGVSVGWRMGYILYMVAQFLISGSMTKFISSPALTLEFVVLNGLLSAILVYGVLLIEAKTSIKAKFRPLYAPIMLAAAVGVQLLV
ncbi:MAG: hypothetical protein JXN10_06960 [Clostridia bacterium]|nr:hypothetical protein [Clostridia bacterium]MBN2883252.1 hypothetical protein [Clostridia bacterium]